MKIEDLKAGRVIELNALELYTHWAAAISTIGRYSLYRHLRTLFSTIALKSVLGQNIQ